MKGMKKAISAVLTVLTTAALAVTAYAAEGSRPLPAIPTTISTTSVATENVKDALNTAIGEGISGTASVTVKSTASLPISASIIKTLKASNDGVLEIKSPKATISIDAATVKKLGKVDLSSKIYSSEKRAVVEFRASAKKNFNCEVEITLTNCKMSKTALANAKLYRDGEAVDGLKINDAGQPVITVKTGGKYEIKAA